jgi:hypothetical protein
MLICSDPRLSTLDDDLAVLYRKAKAAAPDPVAFKKETNHEWRKRQRCTDRDCLVAWYQQRSAQLKRGLNLPEVNKAPIEPASTPAPVPPPTSLAAGDSIGSSELPWLIGGLFLFVWAIRRLVTSERRGPAAAHAAPKKTLLAPAQGGPTVWIGAGQTTTFKALSIPGGMLYVGSTLRAPDGSVEPAQIDPTLEVDSCPTSPQERLFGYWPRYRDISPPARRAYLTWLAGGRQDSTADVGYVFLFFYGLERRVLVDTKTDAAARSEVPAIMAEVERLRAIYGNRSFQNYTKAFLEYVAASGAFEKALYSKEPPLATANCGLPLLLRAGLGQCALDGMPVPAAWALAWARSEPNVSLPRVAGRCPTLFDEQFKQRYRERCAGGLKLSVNRTKLKVTYRPASGGLLSANFTSDFGQLPDVTTVVTPLKKLQSVIDQAAVDLEAYSRFIARHADRAESLEATILLPKALWSATTKAAVSTLDARVGTGMRVVRLEELLSAFGGSASPTRETLKHLIDVLRLHSIGVEPDVLTGAKTPKVDDSVVLFRLAADEVEMNSTARSAYAAIAIMLDLAIALASTDGPITGREVQFLNQQVNTWSHVGESAQRRLRARLRLGILYPPTLGSLKRRIEPLPTPARTALAKLLAGLAMADGKLAQAEVKHLEKIYAALGIELDTLYTELHGAAAAVDRSTAGLSTTTLAPIKTLDASADAPPPQLTTASGAPPSGALHLDPARIAALQAESERVTALLSKVFEEDPPPPPPSTIIAQDAHPEEPSGPPLLWGLDAEHSAFLRVLLTRHSWSRAELNDIAADMEMMLDGALERVNEAALEKYDARLAEGDDPIEIEQDLMENVSA